MAHSHHTDIQIDPGYPIAELIGQRGMAGFWQWDPRSGVIEWSIGIYRILDLEPAEPASLARLENLIHPADRIDHSDPIRNAETGVYDDRLARIIRPNGDLRWISIGAAVIYGTDGEPTMLLGTIVDETRRGAQLKTAQIAERELAALVRIPGFIVWRADATGRMSEIPNWPALTGAEPQAAVGTNWMAAIPIAERNATADAWAAAIAAGVAFEVSLVVQHADGRRKSVVASGVPVIGNGGVVAGWIGRFVECSRSTMSSALGEGLAHPNAPLTGPHVRAARALVGWTAAVLATKAGVSLSTIRRIEDAVTVPEVRQSHMASVRSALERGGVAFRPMPDGTLGLGPSDAHRDPSR